MSYCPVSVQFCLYLDTIVIRSKILPNHQKVSDCPSNNAQKISATIFLATCEWIRLNIETLPKILRYLIMSKLLLSNVRFSASFRRLEESTQPQEQTYTIMRSYYSHLNPFSK